VVARLWKLVLALHRARYGRTAAQLCEELGVSRSTLYRDLSMLDDARVGMARVTVNGETRILLEGLKTLAVTPTVLQVAALRLARDALGPLEGTDVVRELDSLLEQWPPASAPDYSVGPRAGSGSRSALLTVLDAALRTRRRVVIEYQGTQDDAPRRRELDPLVLRLEHDQPYLFAYCHERQDYRLFKLARVAAIHESEKPAGDHADVDLDALLASSVKVWLGGEPERVVVRIARSKARFAAEYPLVPHQEVETLPDGTVLVRAAVTGLVEALRWVLSWGADAEVVAPRELRDAVREELSGALGRYADGPKGVAAAGEGEEVVSHRWDRGGVEGKG
jgi:predicted DNA-binding transcriptional regulator YafY